MPPGRPPLPLGTAGEIQYSRAPSGAVVARTLIRDYDGVSRHLKRSGKSKSAARAALAEAVRDRHLNVAGDLTPGTRFAELTEAWWDSESKDWSPTTRRVYRSRVDRLILPALGGLQMQELTVRRIDRHVQAVAKENGAGSAKQVRSIVSDICGYATRNDALVRNLAKDVGKVHQPRRATKDSLTIEQAKDLRAKLAADKQAVKWGLPILVDYLLSTGLRIAETLATHWSDLELDAGLARVGERLVVRETGTPLYESSHESHKLTPRTLELPEYLLALLRERSAGARSDLAFPAPKGGLADPANTGKQLTAALKRAGYDWVTAHTFRRTLLTWMDEAGLSATKGADQAGHANPSMTQDRYYARRRGSTGAKQLLEAVIAAPPATA